MTNDNQHDQFTMHCDACEKDYVVNAPFSMKEIKKWLNKPCPECGANMLTKADYEVAKVMIGIEKTSIFITGICRFLGLKTRQIEVEFQTNGKGELTITPTNTKAPHD